VQNSQNATGGRWHTACESGAVVKIEERVTAPRYWYFISNRLTRQCLDVVSSSPESACLEVGWELADCAVITVGQVLGSEHAPQTFTRPQSTAVPQRPTKSVKSA